MAMLPTDFADLEPFAETWCLATEPERYEQGLHDTIIRSSTITAHISAR